MKSGGAYGEWFIFHEDLADELQAHFDAGGTMEMLNGTTNKIEHNALYYCVNEHAINCLPIMMANGAKPNDEIWERVLSLFRLEWLRAFCKHGFWPKKEPLCHEDVFLNCQLEVSHALCKNAVIHLLCCAKQTTQPMSHIWKIVARFLYETRYEEVWLNLLEN